MVGHTLKAKPDGHQFIQLIPPYLCIVKGRIWFLLPILWVQGYLVSPDLMKLPLLFAHFMEHQAAAERLDFDAFIALHYDNDDHETQDHRSHENLPFHHHHGAAMDQHFTKVIAPAPLRPVSFAALSARKAIALPVDKDLLAGHHPELLRPPRALA